MNVGNVDGKYKGRRSWDPRIRRNRSSKIRIEWGKRGKSLKIQRKEKNKAFLKEDPVRSAKTQCRETAEDERTIRQAGFVSHLICRQNLFFFESF